MSTPVEDWSAYYEAMQSKSLHPHYANLDPYLPSEGEALELGCGVGQGVVHLLEKGLHVTAVDAEDEALAILRSRLPNGAPAKLVKTDFQELQMDRYDVVVAHFCLFFLTPGEFDVFWPRLVDSIKPGGLLSCQLLGVNDEWRDRGYTTQAKKQVEELLNPFEVLFFEEVERDGETAQGTPKHWHVFHVVARKLA
ncbi:MAG: tellurite methyltransferase [Fimbriimonadaceae bacterium]|jgi:SAM-dependent methyltransferase|nr:tellurite methyltransferase [Fimbriimonadaceae bacterium]